MKKLNQSGSIVMVLLVLILLVTVVGVGYYVISSQSTEEASSSETQQSLSVDETEDEEDEARSSDEGYIAVTEWGVQIGVGEHVAKVQISEVVNGPTYGVEDTSTVKIQVNSDFEYSTNCPGFISITRLKDVSDFDSPPEIKIGDYYYYNSGISECGGVPETGNEGAVSTSDLLDAYNKLGVKEL